MQTAQLPCRLCADVANAVTGAENVSAACNSILAALFSTLLTDAVFLQRSGTECIRLAGRVSGRRTRLWAEHLSSLPITSKTGLIQDGEGPPATFLVIGAMDGRQTFLVIDDDLSGSEAVLESCAAPIFLGLQLAHLREQGRDSARLVRQIYRLLLRVGRAHNLDNVTKAVAGGLANLFQADRVSIAKYDEQDERLRIVAARGVSPDLIGRTVDPPDGVMGQVYQHGRALIVDSAAEWPAPAHQRARYRTGAFAVVPLIHDRRGIGVLSLTEKKNRLRFSSVEQLALRGLAPVVAAAMRGAQRDEELTRLQYAATVDSVTGLHNRAYLDARLHEEVRRSQRENRELSVLMIDVDDLKPINDTRGHSAGDAVLKQVAEGIRSAVRVFDVCARYGGDEFVVVMPHSDAASALSCAERIRSRTIGALTLGGLPTVTLSVGVAVANGHDTPNELIGRADRALYEAKASGKNIVRISGSADAGDHDPLDASPAHRAAGADAADSERPPDLPYMLIADSDPARVALYREHANQSRLGFLVVRDGNQAQRVMDQFGPPSVLVVDMNAQNMNGGALVGWFYAKRTETAILAVSASRTLRQYAKTAPGVVGVTVLHPDAPAQLFRRTLAEIGDFRADSPSAGANAPAEDADVRQMLTALTPKVRGIVGPAGIAIYLKAAHGGAMHAGVSWASQVLPARVHSYLPRVAETVCDSGEFAVIGAIGSPRFPAADVTGTKYWLIATPLKRHGHVIGALCAFADGALELAEDALAHFKSIGEAAVVGPSTASLLPAATTQPLDTPQRAEREQGLQWLPALLERQRGEFEVARELARAKRERRQLSVVLFDVSAPAKPSSTSFGAAEAIEAVAETFVRVVRPSDLPIRWSGSELLLVLPGLTRTDARAVAERVRAAMQAGGRQVVAVSGGVAELEQDEHFGNVVKRARERVMLALHEGHNRVS